MSQWTFPASTWEPRLGRARRSARLGLPYLAQPCLGRRDGGMAFGGGSPPPQASLWCRSQELQVVGEETCQLCPVPPGPQRVT